MGTLVHGAKVFCLSKSRSLLATRFLAILNDHHHHATASNLSLPGFPINAVCQSASHLLNSLQALWELIPVLHHNLDAQSLESLGHLLLLFAASVAPNVANDRDTGTYGTQCPTLAVLHGDALPGFLADDLAGMEVNRWVRFGGWGW